MTFREQLRNQVKQSYKYITNKTNVHVNKILSMLICTCFKKVPGHANRSGTHPFADKSFDKSHKEIFKCELK